MNRFHVLSVTAGAGALVSLGVFAAVAANPQTPDASISADMSTGVTVTQSPDKPVSGQLPVATPAIKGPAPLPAEEQGLPG